MSHSQCTKETRSLSLSGVALLVVEPRRAWAMSIKVRGQSGSWGQSGGGSGQRSVRGESGVTQVQEVLLGEGPAAVPAAGGIGASDAGVLPGLLAVQAVVQQPVGPQALVVPGGGTGHRVAGVDLQRDGRDSYLGMKQGPIRDIMFLYRLSWHSSDTYEYNKYKYNK